MQRWSESNLRDRKYEVTWTKCPLANVLTRRPRSGPTVPSVFLGNFSRKMPSSGFSSDPRAKRRVVTNYEYLEDSVGDPDPYVFGPPGSVSGSVSHNYGSGYGSSSRSFNHQVKIKRKTLISSILWLFYDFLPVFRIRIRIRIRMF